MKINKTHSKKKIILGLAAILLLGAGAYIGIAALNHLPPFASTETTYKPGEQVTNLERSDTEKEAEKVLSDNPELKTQNQQTDTPEQSTETSAGKLAVNVLLTNTGIVNGTVSASGMVTNIVEEGGTCTYTFTNGTNTITKTSQTLINPTSTTCATVRFPASELPVAGTWKVDLTYSSSKAAGKSGEKEFSK